MAKVKLTTLTPVHVGNGNFLQNNIEFIKASFNNSLSAGVIDDRKVLNIIGSENVDAWVSIIDKKEDLFSYLKSRKQDVTLNDISRRIIPIADSDKNFISLKEHIHNGQGCPYIPGSTIKGSLRSAVFNWEMRNRKKQLTESEVSSGKYVSSRNLEGILFGNDPKVDVFRFLQVGDAYFQKGCTVALNLKSLNIIQDGRKVILDDKVQQLVESIDTEYEVELDIKLNESLLKYNQGKGYIDKHPVWMEGLDSLFKLVNDNTLLLLEEEIAFWKVDDKFESVEAYISELEKIRDAVLNSNEDECVTRLGHGVGWTFINGAWIKKEEIVSDYLYKKIVGSSRPKNERYENYPFPKTRRVSDSESVIEVMGFINLKKI